MNAPFRKMTLTPEQLSETFHDFFPVSSQAKITKLAGDISHREYFRVENLSSGKTMVLQSSEAFPDKLPSFIWIARALNDLSINAPVILAQNDQKGWVLMEDLGDEFLQMNPSSVNYLNTVQILLQWQESFWENNPQIDKTFPFWNFAFDCEKFNQEMQYTQTHLFSERSEKFHQSFKSFFLANNAYLIDRNAVFCHRDFHSRNIMIQNNQTYVIDFQDARKGPLTYDIVSLLWDPYVNLKTNERSDLFDHWKKLLEESSSAELQRLIKKTKWKLDSVDFLEEVERMKLQRLLKAIGTYGAQYKLKNNKSYLNYIEPAVGDIRAAYDALTRLKRNNPSDDNFFNVWSTELDDLKDMIEKWKTA